MKVRKSYRYESRVLRHFDAANQLRSRFGNLVKPKSLVKPTQTCWCCLMLWKRETKPIAKPTFRAAFVAPFYFARSTVYNSRFRIPPQRVIHVWRFVEKMNCGVASSEVPTRHAYQRHLLPRIQQHKFGFFWLLHVALDCQKNQSMNSGGLR